jgi:hypothetical protein
MVSAHGDGSKIRRDELSVSRAFVVLGRIDLEGSEVEADQARTSHPEWWNASDDVHWVVIRDIVDATAIEMILEFFDPKVKSADCNQEPTSPPRMSVCK